MTPEKILEIARRYDSNCNMYSVSYVFSKEDLIAFAQSVIEAERDLTTIKVPTVIFDKLKDVNTVTDLINALKAAEKTE